jgi:hypothetical protein
MRKFRTLSGTPVIETWRRDYEENQPHQALTDLALSEYAVKLTA